MQFFCDVRSACDVRRVIYFSWWSSTTEEISCTTSNNWEGSKTVAQSSTLQKSFALYSFCTAATLFTGLILAFIRIKMQQGYKYTLQTRNLAIANGSRVSCAHNTSRASIVIPWPWNHSRSLKLVPFEVIGESGFEAQAGPIIVSGYSGVCFEIKFSGRHRWFDGVLLICNRWLILGLETLSISSCLNHW